ncbi:exodeoxyribonuclease VII large subunit [uncultured Proteiniphilum sp.]|uniref:exodeoxyribonuclease VII large subunit n=1 Tax=uncultured Proteiniphilum sp. TaxID=497637 RepID=UPI002638C015|nr:exodeoxyribonuclease VII large subunit [uncultured Proteiniphilum sp.]
MNESSLTLSELNRQVKDAIRDRLPETYWMRAETSDVRRNRNGHCYLEFVEKDTVTQSIIAKARGVIWANIFQMLSAYFESETGEQLSSGISVLVRVSVEFHELYGYSLTVVDIDPSFTVGEIVRNRQLVLRQLEEEGVLALNRELYLPELVNRIAVISSPTAAGYEDFCNQLTNNPARFVFYTKLFPAIMQGERSEASIIEALEKVFHYRELFDAVAIIRGGGASSDLSCFDSYLLATNVAQFPLPVISGIGHERDITVLDIVAHTRAKTPTAVAEFFIAHLTKTATELINLEERAVSESESRLMKEQSDLFSLSRELVYQSSLMLQREVAAVQQLSGKVRYGVRRLLQDQFHILENRAQFMQMVSPANILKRGYTLTLKNGKIVTSLQDLSVHDIIETCFRDGVSTSVIMQVVPEKPQEGD